MQSSRAMAVSFTERSADPNDQASYLETAQREAAIAMIRTSVSERGHAHCIECDEPISASRRRHVPWAKRCVVCQEEHERRVALRA